MSKYKQMLIAFDENQYFKDDKASLSNLLPRLADLPASMLRWFNFEKLDPAVVKELSDFFEIHPLVQEDILNTEHRVKIEDWDDYLYLVVKMAYEKANVVKFEQVSFVLGPNYLLCFQQFKGDVFDYIRDRVEKSKGRIRSKGSDYLLYVLLDAIVDNYLKVLSQLAERIDSLTEDPENLDAAKMLKFKRRLNNFKKQMLPIVEVAQALHKNEYELCDDETRVFFKDLYDHSLQVKEDFELIKDQLQTLLENHHLLQSAKLNETMKTLTIFATIFMPITFIAGIYGMNFDSMPELHLSWAYPAVLGIMFLVAIAMVMYFKVKKWL